MLVECRDRQPSCFLSFFVQASSPSISLGQAAADPILAEQMADFILAEQWAKLEENKIHLVHMIFRQS